MKSAWLLGILCAVLLHAGVLLFGGLIFATGKPDHGTLQQVELLSPEDLEAEKKKPEEQPKPEELETQTEQAPDATEILRELDQPLSNEPPALDAVSLGALEQALAGGPGGDFGEALSLASGGRIGGLGKAGALDDKLEGAFSLSEIDQKPRAVFKSAPLYPSEMRGKKVEGCVTLTFVVDASGKVASARVEKSTHPAFEKPALEALKQWKFEPAVKAGQRVGCKMRVHPVPGQLKEIHVHFLPLALLPSLLLPQGESEIRALWNDPVFQKQFVGTYGINADIEPRVTPEEVAILEKIRPLMGSDLPKAEQTLRKQMKPNCSAILDFTLGSLAFQQDKLADAQANYEKAVAKFPSFRRAWRNLGLIHVRNAKYDESIRAFVRMIELGGADGYAFGLLGFAYASKSDFQAAEAAYRSALLMQPDSTEWRLGLTRCVYKQEKFQDAATLLDALLAKYPEKADFWLLQAHTYLGLKQPLKAAANLEALDQLGKATADSQQTLGDIYVGESLMDLALHAYTRAVELDPQQPLARPLRAAEVLSARGANRQARALLARLAEVHPQAEEAEQRKLLKLQARLAMAEGDDSDATAAVLEELVQLDPLDGEALLLLGQHFGRKGEPDRAILYFERAEGLGAFEVNARLRHAQTLVGMGRYADALPLLRRVQELKPRDDVARYLEQVERLSRSRRS